MINISRLYCGEATGGDWLRYGEKSSDERKKVSQKASERRPIVVWNITRECNLRCVHCYNDSGAKCNEATNQEARAIIDDLAEYGVSSLIFSGGEPLMRDDLFDLIGYAGDKGLRTVISTNGTLITSDKAQLIKKSGTGYVGISLDGIGKVNDKFRGVEGAFEKAVVGIRNCQNVGVRVGLRLTLTQSNVCELEKFFDFFQQMDIERACFYHLVPSGRGGIGAEDLTAEQSRAAIELILATARHLKEIGRKTDILTVDNHADGAYVYLKLLSEDAARAEAVWKLLSYNGGGMYSSGVGIGCIDFNGKVHADQFWSHYDLGDVRKRKFSQIWESDEPLLKGLRDRRGYIKGRCRLCRFFEICGGSLRVRADLRCGDAWAPDPSCYLSDQEIGL